MKQIEIFEGNSAWKLKDEVNKFLIKNNFNIISIHYQRNEFRQGPGADKIVYSVCVYYETKPQSQF